MNLHMSQATSMQNADKNPAQNIGQTPKDESQLKMTQKMGNQQAMTTRQPASAMNRPAQQVSFAPLIRVIKPQLDKGRAKQLQGLYGRLLSNNINKEEFVRQLRSLVGDRMLKMAAYEVQQRQLTAKPSSLPMDLHGVHKSSNVDAIKQESDQRISIQGLGKQHQQKHMPFRQSSVANYNYSSRKLSLSSQSFKQQTLDFTSSSGLQQSSRHWQSSMRKDQSLVSSMAYAKQEPFDQTNDKQHKYESSVPQGSSSISLGQIESSKEETFEMMSPGPSFSTSMNKQEPVSVTAQLKRHNASAGNSSLASGSNAETPPIKPTVGLKKPLEAHESSLCKKQKVSGAFSDQNIEQLNDVTAVSVVNLREEDSRVSEASRKVVQEEEEMLILQKTPLQKKLAEIMEKCGIKKRSNEVERCLELCVEERMRGLISNLIRLSKQKLTSDVRNQILSMNQKAWEEWEKKQAGAEKLQIADKLLDDDGDVELLDPKQEQCESVENVSPVAYFVEKLSSIQSDMFCVQGYKVKRSNATILEAIFKKHGDIANKCVFKTNSVRSSFLDAICEVVAQIQSNDFIEKMEQIETRMSDAEAATIDVTWLRAHLKAINRRKETDKKYKLLMKMKENTILLRKVVQVDLRERCSEFVASQQRFKKAERFMRVFQLVEKNLNGNILESKAKIHSWVNYLVDDNDDDVEPLDTKQEQCELDENASDSMENFLSPQSGIICVEGYKVNQRNARILEAIFKKHGDITAKCVFKTHYVRSSFLEVVCEVVRRIQANDVIGKIKEIECLVSDAEAANIDVSWLQTHLEAINKRKEASNYNLLMEMKENVILVTKAAQTDMRERHADLVAAHQRFKMGERCVRVLHLVEKNLNDNILESKAKIDSWVNHTLV